MSNAPAILASLLADCGLDPSDTGGAIAFSSADPVVDSRHRLGEASAAAIAAAAAGMAALWRLRGGEGQDIAVDARRAAVLGLRSIYHIEQSGHRHDVPPRSSYPPVSFFDTRDGKKVFVLRAVAYTETLLKTLDLLNCTFAPGSMAAAIAQWDGLDLEEALAEKRLVGVMARTGAEWRAHPQGALLASRPVIDIVKIADSAPRVMPAAERPLGGIRVLDFTHVLAGPVVARTLAEQGAEVLHITAPRHIDPVRVAIDTGLGKRSAFLDLDLPEQAAVARQLAAGADVFTQSWRPGSLQRHGLGAEQLAEINPGLVYVSVSCYGSDGPWARRGGYEPCGQTACGFVIDEGSADAPRMAVTGTMNDYLVGYLAAAGAAAALLRQSREGGAYHVKVSLTRTSMWLQDIGRLPEADWPQGSMAMTRDPEHMMAIDSPMGRLTVPKPIAQYARTPAFWSRPPEPFGASTPNWEHSRKV